MAFDPDRTAPYVPASQLGGFPRIPGYDVLEQIARGGMGRVLAARDRTLDREVAIKVLLPGLPVAEASARFIRESKITGRLAHPGIPPIYQLGTLPDGSPFLAMKLIRGRTLASILASRGNSREQALPDSSTPDLIAVFEQICQAVGFAHSQHIIHRDLKPANVMVGAFGEVQVMDWGLAKDTRVETEAVEAVEYTNGDFITTGLPWSLPDDLPTPGAAEDTQPGAVLGTVPFMPPEQAKGDLAQLGPWSDVFSLGGILCQILTGKPPYSGFPVQTLLALAESCDTAAAFARLDQCDADPELIELCKRCLAKRPTDRPANAEVAARLIAAYRTGVEERLRAAERDRAAAEAKAAEQKKKRRVQRALTGAVTLLVCAGIGFAWYRSWQSEEARLREAQLESDKQIELARKDLERAQVEADRKIQAAASAAQKERLHQEIPQLLKLAEEQRRRHRHEDALATLERAWHLANSGQTDDLEPVVAQARDDQQFVADLDTIRMRRSVRVMSIQGKSGFDTQSAPPAYRTAFAARKYDLQQGPVAELATRIAASPIKGELVTALDDWAVFEPDAALAARLLEVARLADPGPWSDQFRDPAVRSSPPLLAWVARKADPTALSPGTITALSELMERRGLDPTPVLIAARSTHADDFLIAFVLGNYLDRHDYKLAAEPYRIAVALRPKNSGARRNLASTLLRINDNAGALREYQIAVALDPQDPDNHSQLGVALLFNGRIDEAIPCYREAVRLDPTDCSHMITLGIVLTLTGEIEEAIAWFDRVIEREPNNPLGYTNKGFALAYRKQYKEAIGYYREAIRLDPNDAITYRNMGQSYFELGDDDECIKAYRTALRLDPNDRLKLSGEFVGKAQRLTENKQRSRAMRYYREAIRINPGNVTAHNELGVALLKVGDLEEAIPCFEAAIEADPNYAPAHHNLGIALYQQGKVDAALRHVRTAVQLDPNESNSQDALEILQRVRAYRNTTVTGAFGIKFPRSDPP